MLEVDAGPVVRRCRGRGARSDVEEDVGKTRGGLGSGHPRGRGRWGIVTWMREERVQLDWRWKVKVKVNMEGVEGLHSC